jgi:tetratricopeptide (TPR) repeat protein
MKKLIVFFSAFLLLTSFAQSQTAPSRSNAPASATSNPLPSRAADLVKMGRKLQGEGKLDEAISAENKALSLDADSYDAQSALGAALDLKGDYTEARKHLQKAIELADADHKPGALRAMAISFAFDRDSKDTTTYGWQAYQLLLDAKKPADAAGAANELARIQLESGDIDRAARTYIAGCAVGAKSATTPADQDLWQFRIEHALARIAARRGNKDEAEKHVAAAKAVVAKNTLPPNQAIFVPYLTGYVAFYLGDYNAALTDLQQADQKDPFILALIAQTEEKLGDKTTAREYWTRVLAIYSHNPTNAFARPLAKKALGI